jgi:hypothetical protein
MPDDVSIELGKREMARLVSRPANCGGWTVRIEKAYPVYDGTYKRGLDTIREFLKEVPNLQLVGRNGMHRYNNQDHSMLTAVLAARNIMGANYDLWSVNAETDYHEEGGAITEKELASLNASQPAVPVRIGGE